MRIDCRPDQRRRGFSLIELLMSIMILAIGLISVAALFPAGIVQQQRAKDDVDGPTVAKAAMDTLRARLSQEDFGGWTDFYTEDQVDDLMSSIKNDPAFYLRPDDWPWQRPALVVPQGENDPLRGTVDVFNRLGYEGERDMVTDRTGDDAFFTNFQSRRLDSAGTASPLGIPFAFEGPWPEFPTSADLNRLVPPLVIFGQAERAWPPDDGSGRSPQYYWDFMLRRHAGRVHVAVFVYRVVKSGGGSADWAVQPLDFSGDQIGLQSPVPMLNALGQADRWATGHGDGRGPGGSLNPLPQTDGSFDPTDAVTSWQYPGQYITDNLGMVHRVSRGRTRPDQVFEDQRGVLLDNEIPPVQIDARVIYDKGGSSAEILPQSMSQIVPFDSIDAYLETPGLLAGGFVVEQQDSVLPDVQVPLIDRLWFVPRTLELSGQQWELIPVFLQVEQL